MALTPSGAISLSDINTALGRSSTASINMNDTQVRFIANADTNASSINMNSLRDKYYFNGTITVGFYSDKSGTVIGFTTAYGNGSITGGLFGGSITSYSAQYGSNTIIDISGSTIPNRSTYRTRTERSGTYNVSIPLTWGSTISVTDYTTGYELFGNNALSNGLTYNWYFAG